MKMESSLLMMVERGDLKIKCPTFFHYSEMRGKLSVFILLRFELKALLNSILKPKEFKA